MRKTGEKDGRGMQIMPEDLRIQITIFSGQMRHYSSIGNPEYLYTAETIATKRLLTKKKVFKEDPEIAQKNENAVTFQLRLNQELDEKFEKMKKIKLAFYVPLRKMKPERLTNKSLNFQEN